VVIAAPASSAATDTARLAEAGIDVGELAPGWSVVGDEIWWETARCAVRLAPPR
jgi:hypothetical protein